MFETTVTVVGNVSTDVVLRQTQDGSPFVSFGVISTERRFDAKTESWSASNKLFVWVTGWKRLANGAASSLKKGDPVIVTGKLRVDEYEKDGEKRTLVKVNASAIGPNLAFCTADAQRNSSEDVNTFLRAVDLDQVGGDPLPPALSAVAV
ncbi:single-stranded DNA-binding protein [Kutzneria kofuensis]|uniref:Single-stranded DNA-binding protein n=1 Tax=Kutzneria kofuensis TaxID=103725 RepID=A0A7W9KE09_9PSEU|nr:single-stranded DNA-binding protein [Kutzneria kofuensis]MBB5890863.1 single-strand DNA-binding protein [Kutzneria kofuensis]